MNETNTYYLDPDFRKDPKTEIFCVRCQKDIKGKAINVLVNWNNWTVREVKGSTELIGKNCWKKITL